MPNVTRRAPNAIITGLNKDPTYKVIDKFGRNPSVGTSLEDIWSQGGVLTFLTTARTMIVDTTGNDNGTSSTGARKVMIQGLDANYLEVEEEVTTNAAASPTTTQTFLRVNRAFVTEVGSLGLNENAITITATTDATVQASISALVGQTLKTQFTVKAGHTAYITRFFGGSSKGDGIQFLIETRLFNTASNNNYESWRTKRDLEIFESHISVQLDDYIQLPEKTDVRIQALTDASTAKVAAGYDMIIVAN